MLTPTPALHPTCLLFFFFLVHSVFWLWTPHPVQIPGSKRSHVMLVKSQSPQSPHLRAVQVGYTELPWRESVAS